MALPRILLIDDNKTRSQQFEIILQFMEYQVETAGSSNYAAVIGQIEPVFGIFVGDGIDKQALVIKEIVELTDNVPVILLIDKGAALRVPTAINNRVFQVQEWPVAYPGLKPTIDKLSAAYGQRQGNPVNFQERRVYERRSSAIERLQGNSQAIVNIRKSIAQVAESDATVLILGESGTGKEVIARALHDASCRKSKPFVPINCGAIPGELLESELFGHEKGAFTGALNARQGRFEMAEGGTLFLDEIGDMPTAMQVKLLRVLQERTFERVGSNKTIYCDVRVIAATHRSLEEEIKSNRFREDLFYRLNVFPIEVPALRERAGDIPLLVQDLIARLEAANRGSVQLTNAALAVLMQHTWPGNVRELANLIERLAIIYPKGLVDVADLPEKFQHYPVPEEMIVDTPAANAEDLDRSSGVMEMDEQSDALPASLAHLPEQGIDLKEYLNVLEGDLIRQALVECNGVVAHAAKRLNMRRTTLVEKLRKYDVQR
ncbi:sigma-54 dependent transcriptional regulator [Methylobacter marinus]|uniref:sigma-54 dependent transcriptional regulator n=1 Tax=Methylobacter marinus TaxID=34058 RepID=UPI00036031C0|nr:sigma-54 dependent transcriptional regulator [Methylobacter marinus]